MWVCGLKPISISTAKAVYEVTPYVGVWIETARPCLHEPLHQVTPYVGVWIETMLIIYQRY